MASSMPSPNVRCFARTRDTKPASAALSASALAFTIFPMR